MPLCEFFFLPIGGRQYEWTNCVNCERKGFWLILSDRAAKVRQKSDPEGSTETKAPAERALNGNHGHTTVDEHMPSSLRRYKHCGDGRKIYGDGPADRAVYDSAVRADPAAADASAASEPAQPHDAGEAGFVGNSRELKRRFPLRQQKTG